MDALLIIAAIVVVLLLSNAYMIRWRISTWLEDRALARKVRQAERRQ